MTRSLKRSGRPTRILALGAAFAASLAVTACDAAAPTAAATPVEASEPAFLDGVLGDLTLLTCSPLPADTASRVIGPAGGTIHVGPHRFTVPPGALSHDVTITAIVPSDSVNRVRFFPDGLQFEYPARLTMSYANCGPLTWLVPRRIVYIDEHLSILEVLPSFNDFWHRTVSARLDHFSDYAVAW